MRFIVKVKDTNPRVVGKAAKEMSWASFVNYSDAVAFEDATRVAHPTWSVRTVEKKTWTPAEQRAHIVERMLAE